jgi:molecular chaperone GrpE
MDGTMSDPKNHQQGRNGAPEAARNLGSESSLSQPGAESDIASPEPFTELENLYAENAALKDKLLRSLAEMENLRRRTDREVADAKTYGVSKFAREMLSFSDNLRRAIDSVPAQARADKNVVTLLEGMELMERDFLSRLSQFGVTKMDPKGQRFDPNQHEALFEIPDETQPNGVVAQVIETGYLIGDRVLRPAKVGVARGGPKA